jgi:hypothetical protein
MEYSEAGYRKWETKMNKMARRKAREYFKCFVEDDITYDVHIHRSNMCKIDEIYLLTKIQTILMYSDVVMEHKIEESQEDDWKWEVTVYLYTQAEYDALPSSSDTPSESEDEGEDPL